jgi:pimeloyl-ACP methyl ester carboxylesterase
MRTVRCRVCGERVRKDRIDSHMRAVHRKGGQLRALPLALAVAAIIIVTAVAIWLIRQPAPSEENGGGGTLDPDAVAVQFNSDDGWVIKGTYYRENESMPVVILVPGVGEGRGSYGPLVEELRAKGYNVLAYDPRGCGESVYQNGRKREWKDFTDADFQAGTNDVTKARQYALATYLSAPKVAVIGASLGANQALAAAAAETVPVPELKALVLLAPGSAYRGVESAPAVQALNNRAFRPAIFFAASRDDPTNSAPVAQSLNQSYAGRRSLEILDGGAHGTVLLTYPAFRTETIQFLDDVFKS